jgi:SAM-dependent methyltransferase
MPRYAHVTTTFMTHATHHDVPEALRNGRRVRDDAFDSVYPEAVRKVSSRSWTPVEVARTAARWFAAEGARRVQDVGSGPGKFCVVAALTADLQLTGLEQRQDLVAISKAAAQAYGASAARRFRPTGQGGRQFGGRAPYEPRPRRQE